MERRTLIKNSIISVASASVGAQLLRAATPSQPEGPFHPVNIDNDLRRLKPSSPLAQGLQIHIEGVIRNAKTRAALSGVFVEIWQADSQGKYAHPEDPLDLEPDPNFQFWGRTRSDTRGLYEFFSIKPGSYPASQDWIRPPHIHMQFSLRGFHALTTQMYFEGEELNERDFLLNNVPRQDRHKLVVRLQRNAAGLMTGCFDIELDPVLASSFKSDH